MTEVKNLSFGKDLRRSLPEYTKKTVSKSRFMLSFSEASNKLPAWWSTDLIISFKFSSVCSASRSIWCVTGHLQPGWKVVHPVWEWGGEPQPRDCSSELRLTKMRSPLVADRETEALAGCRCIHLNLYQQANPAQLSERISSDWSRIMYLSFIYEILNLPDKVVSESQTCFILTSWRTHRASSL